jgi:hypothetical protein
MEINKELLNVFLSLHNRKAKTTTEPTVYLVKKDDCLKSDTPLVAWKEQHLVNYFDHDSKQFQWLMKQLKTYDCRNEVILGIFSDNKTVFSEVLKKNKL